MSSEEMELTEVVLEALSSIMSQPQTHKYTRHILRHTSNILNKFGKILEKERQSTDPNKVDNIIFLEELVELRVIF